MSERPHSGERSAPVYDDFFKHGIAADTGEIEFLSSRDFKVLKRRMAWHYR